MSSVTSHYQVATSSPAVPHMSSDKYFKLAVMHAIVGGVATLIIFPLGAILGRRLRAISSNWWMAHAFIQVVLGVGALTAAVVTGFYLVDNGKDATPGHRLVGILLIIAAFIQSIAGGITKLTTPPLIAQTKVSQYRGLFHAICGVGVIGLGFWQTWTGLDLFIVMTKRALPIWVFVAWGACAGVFLVVYGCDLLKYPAVWRKEMTEKANALKAMEEATAAAAESAKEGSDAGGDDEKHAEEEKEKK